MPEPSKTNIDGEPDGRSKPSGSQEIDDLMAPIRERFETAIISSFANSRIVELPFENALPHISIISFENTNGEMIAALLEEKGIRATTGSRCGGNSIAAIDTMNVPYSEAMGTVRFELSPVGDNEYLDDLITTVNETVSLVQSFG